MVDHRPSPPSWLEAGGRAEWDRLFDLFPYLAGLDREGLQKLAILSSHITAARVLARELNVDLALEVSSAASLRHPKTEKEARDDDLP